MGSVSTLFTVFWFPPWSTDGAVPRAHGVVVVCARPEAGAARMHGMAEAESERLLEEANEARITVCSV